MGKFIMHHEGRFFEWSTVSDAPATDPMGAQAFVDYYRTQYGVSGLSGLETRMQRAIDKGTSAHGPEDFESIVFINRAGPNEAELTVEEIKEWVMGFKV